MIPVDLTGKTAFVTGLADNVGFGWHIAKALQAAGAELILGSHPRVVGIAQRFLTGDKYKDSRALPFGVDGELSAKAIFGCDVGYDTADDIPEDLRTKKGYVNDDVSIAGCMEKIKEITPHLDIVIHCVGFSPEIANNHLNTSREAYLTAMSVSSYSLVALTRAAMPLMKGRQGSVVGLTYNASQRVVPYYGGGMASAKAALESDARNCAWFAGEEGHRVNIISAGPYASRAARSIGDIGTMIDETAERSPIRQPITPEQVANATLFLCSEVGTGVTGECLFVDNGFNIMGV